MDTDKFIQWAIDDARTTEERYPVELLVEQGVHWWNSRRKIYKSASIDEMIEQKRRRALNPAYEPHYTEQNLRRAAEMFPDFKTWTHFAGHDERPIRDLTVFGFLTNLEELHLNNNEATDLSPLTRLPKLRNLQFGSSQCEDFRPLARCTALRNLVLMFYVSWWKTIMNWPDVSGLEQLTQLESLSLTGNLLVFERGVAWPNVRCGTLKCEPLAARSVKDLPGLPACEFLTLAGVERLDGIEAFPRLRNLRLETDVRDFAPLAALTKLTCFTCTAFEPLDLRPLVRLPKLQCVSFDTRFKHSLRVVAPRDFSPLGDAPMLRELHVEGCAPVEDEVKMLNTLLPPWDDLLLAVQARPLPPLRMIVAPWTKHPRNETVKLDPDDNGLPDEGLRECEGRWVKRFVEKTLSERLGHEDWGTAEAGGKYRSFSVTIESFAVVEKFPQIIEIMREILARLRQDYVADFMIALKAPRPEPTPAQVEMEEQFREAQDKAEWERRQREQEEYLERLHRYDLKKQLGDKIKPEEFVPPPATPLPAPPWESDDDNDDDDSASGDVIVKEKPEPPPSWLDDEHPLAGNYRIMGHLLLSEIWFACRQRDLATYLMGRPPDQELPDDPAQS